MRSRGHPRTPAAATPMRTTVATTRTPKRPAHGDRAGHPTDHRGGLGYPPRRTCGRAGVAVPRCARGTW